MGAEAREAPDAVRRLLADEYGALARAGEALSRIDPPLLATLARGSSDHAAHYLSYAVQVATGRPVASLPPSTITVYGARPRLDGAALLAVSQSGRGPDLVAVAQAARAAGALTIGLVNAPDAPLSEACEIAVPLLAGPEESVAATKSVVAAVAAGLAILARWTNDAVLARALDALPERLEEAIACDWTHALDTLSQAPSLYVLGRGPGLAVAGEVALKMKEAAGLHAEAFSGAEVRHGPVRLAGPDLPVLALAVSDAARNSLVEALAAMRGRGTPVLMAGDTRGVEGATPLPAPAPLHPLLDPLVLLLPAYRLVDAIAAARGENPDAPPGLQKVTRTL